VEPKSTQHHTATCKSQGRQEEITQIHVVFLDAAFIGLSDFSPIYCFVQDVWFCFCFFVFLWYIFLISTKCHTASCMFLMFVYCLFIGYNFQIYYIFPDYRSKHPPLLFSNCTDQVILVSIKIQITVMVYIVLYIIKRCYCFETWQRERKEHRLITFSSIDAHQHLQQVFSDTSCFI
jgi:hypothetical protein